MFNWSEVHFYCSKFTKSIFRGKIFKFFAGDRRDWGTGIAQKKFRVGSPTFFSNPNINIPGLMDDLDGFSCSDSEEEVDDLAASKKLDIDEVEDVGNVRIEFRGRNLAEVTKNMKNFENIVKRECQF